MNLYNLQQCNLFVSDSRKKYDSSQPIPGNSGTRFNFIRDHFLSGFNQAINFISRIISPEIERWSVARIVL